MDMNHYQKVARRTAIYPQAHLIIYPVLGLVGEAGEVAEKCKKVLRDNNGVFTKERIDTLKKEMGDVLWYLANLATDLGLSLADVAQMNLDKLAARQENNRLHGDGDDR